MIVYYRDDGGYFGAQVDSDGVSFLDGNVYFCCNGEDKRIPVDSLVAIAEDKE